MTPHRFRSCGASMRCAAAPACTSATPMTARACTTWRSRSSTTRWTRRRPDFATRVELVLNGDGSVTVTRRRARDPDRHPPRGRHFGRRGRADTAARRRQVQPELLQGVRRPARRRRGGGQRALRVDGGAHLAARRRAHRSASATATPRRRWPWSGPGDASQRHRGDVQAEPRHVHPHRVRLRAAGAPAARAGVPEFRPRRSCCATNATRRRWKA